MPFPLSFYAQEPDRPEECFYLVTLYFPCSRPRRFINFKEGPNPFEYSLGEYIVSMICL